MTVHSLSVAPNLASYAEDDYYDPSDEGEIARISQRAGEENLEKVISYDYADDPELVFDEAR